MIIDFKFRNYENEKCYFGISWWLSLFDFLLERGKRICGGCGVRVE